MYARLLGFIIVASWVAATGWLVKHDLLPVWTASPAPSPLRADWLAEGRTVELQCGVFRDNGRIGTMWTIYRYRPQVIEREDLILLEDLVPQLPSLRVEGGATFTPEGALDSLKVELRVSNHGFPITLSGERFPQDFAFTLDAGLGGIKPFKVPIGEADMIAEAFNPFTTLPKLSVGQSWRMQVINPLAALLNLSEKFRPVVVRVTGREKRATNFGARDCFVVEAEGVTAWVDDEGVVQVQEVRLPIGSTIRLLRERYDETLHRIASDSRRLWELPEGEGQR